MRDDVAARLQRLNREFYQQFAGPFDETRARPQPGVLRALGRVPLTASVLDLGCGGGVLAAALAARGQRGAYLGIDTSEALLARARSRPLPTPFGFQRLELIEAGWEERLPRPWDRVLLFALLHHIPGAAARARLVAALPSLLGADGEAVVSVWDPLASARLRQRCLPWETAGLSADDVEPGDLLMDWRRGGRGLRYVHCFDPDGLAALAEAAGLDVVESYRADGEGGRLGLYQVWRPAAASGAGVF